MGGYNKSSTYSDNIIKNGAIYGYKTANLMNLKDLTERFNNIENSFDLVASVPNFQGFTDADLKSVLATIVPEWEQKWQNFV